MKNFGPPLFVLLALATSIAAQDTTPPTAQFATTQPPRLAAELEQLLAPIALYPDALIALILPASTAPADIVLAARQMRGNNNDRSQVEARSWDDSVKSLTYYPDLLKWLDDNLDWTKQVGEAFMADPAEVMNTIQRLRARARAAGALVDTPQQQILTMTDVIRIVPTQPNVIYVPSYEPGILYFDRPGYYPLPPIGFGVGFAVGSWLAYDCDWVRRKVWVGDRHRRWQGQDWHRPVVSTQPDHPGAGSVRYWQPPSRPVPPAVNRADYSRGQNNRPSPGATANFDSRISPATQPPEFNNLSRAPRPGVQREIPGPRTGVAANPPTPTAPPLPRQSNPTRTRGSEPRVRSLPDAIGGTPVTIAPPLRSVAPALPIAGPTGPQLSPGVSYPLPVTLVPSLPTVAPSLPAAVPSLPAAPAYQAPVAAPSNTPEPGDRPSRRNGREQLN